RKCGGGEGGRVLLLLVQRSAGHDIIRSRDSSQPCEEVSMRCVSRKIFSITLFLLAGYLTQVIQAQQPPSATVFEGARLITGDGSAPLADSAFVVENGRFTAIGRKGQVKAPAGAAHVDLTGKTVIPTIIDAHKHLAVTRDALVDQLQHFAYYGIG